MCNSEPMFCILGSSTLQSHTCAWCNTTWHGDIHMHLFRLPRYLLRAAVIPVLQLDIVESEDIKSGFSVKFTFAENPFFSNRELVRDIRFSEEGALQVTTTQIQWLPGAEPSGIEGGAAVGSKRSSPDNQYVLFSSWFTGRTETELEGHDDVADVLKEDIWPDPLRWHREAEETMADLFQPDDEGEEGEEFDDDEFDGDDAPAGEEGDEGVYVEERDEGEEVIEVADDDEGDDAQE
eukprot:GHRR01026907.1.p1 GENE.GHRR01026907.1~~GHRR01026907.1.p1  ORF type:complete len:236 (+),score=57.68 GHRR01026907.1:299-1006(+)